MKGLALLFAAALAAPIDASAHRLDEYLQAARFSIERNRVEFEIDLTPGTSVAPQVFALIDTNEDGRISEAEGAAYAEQLHRSIELSVDGTPVALHFAPGQFPPRSEMIAGTGMIRLHASADFPAVAAGLHQLFYRNTHHPEFSVYLSNALVPTDSAIAITAQHRDTTQNELAIDYRVTPKAALFPKWLLLACCSILGWLLQSWESFLEHSPFSHREPSEHFRICRRCAAMRTLLDEALCQASGSQPDEEDKARWKCNGLPVPPK